MFMAPSEEHQARLEALPTALGRAMQAGTESAYLWRLTRLVLERNINGWSKQRIWSRCTQAGCSQDRLRSRPRCLSSESGLVRRPDAAVGFSWIGKKRKPIRYLVQCSAKAVPKGCGYHLVADYGAVNAHLELVP